MKIWKRVVFLTLALLTLAATVSPAIADDTFTLRIRNLTQSVVELKLNGPELVKLTISQPYTNVELKPGTYTYRYVACGRLFTGTFRLLASRTFKLLKCEKGLNATLVINNLTGKPFELLLNGAKTYYYITIQPGDHKYTVQAGRYEYRAFVCGAFHTGEKGLKSKNNNDWIWSCK